VLVVLLLLRREEEATHPFCAEEEEEEERMFIITFFPVVVVVVVDLIIVILFLVCRVAQKQLLDAILIILVTQSCFFYSRFKHTKELKSVGKKERKKKEEREKNENEGERKVFFEEEKLGFRKFLCFSQLPDCVSDKSISKKGGVVQTPHNNNTLKKSIKQRFQKKLRTTNKKKRESVRYTQVLERDSVKVLIYCNTTKRA
tara:strand:+ start:177 stop:779 length:603 start_codon:yes stop_codon:yes gene_type:complete